jgi:Arc/MetJ-type ribon-helix-helix transcriptional regulator
MRYRRRILATKPATIKPLGTLPKPMTYPRHLSMPATFLYRLMEDKWWHVCRRTFISQRTLRNLIERLWIGRALPDTICMDGIWMSDRWWQVTMTVHELRPKAGESEKITINLGFVDLGQIDLLVQEGFYSNRTDFIRTAIRNQLTTHSEVVKQTVARKTFVLGLQHFSRQDLEAVQEAGEQLQIQVLGLARIAEDVPPELARATIASVAVLGAFQASAAVKAILADRIH